MKHSLEATIAAMLVLAAPTSTEARCGKDKVAFLANSYIVTLNRMLNSPNRYTRKRVASWGVSKGNLVLDDGRTYTTDSGGRACKRAKNCDPYSFIGQTVWDMERNLDRFIADIKRKGVTRVIVYEGVNSIAPGKSDDVSNEKKMKRIRSSLERIVKRLKAQKVNGRSVKVYMAEMPVGISGSTANLSWHNVNEYNQNMIPNVGADGILQIGDLPWGPGHVHGFVEETFPYIMAKTHEMLNRGCGYARFQAGHYQRLYYEKVYNRAHSKTQPRSGKRRR